MQGLTSIWGTPRRTPHETKRTTGAHAMLCSPMHELFNGPRRMFGPLFYSSAKLREHGDISL